MTDVNSGAFQGSCQDYDQCATCLVKSHMHSGGDCTGQYDIHAVACEEKKTADGRVAARAGLGLARHTNYLVRWNAAGL